MGTGTTSDSKRGIDYRVRLWYYDKKKTDIDAKKDVHPEIRALYYTNNRHDKDFISDKDVTKILIARKVIKSISDN